MKLVVKGQYSVLDMGPYTGELLIALFGVVMIAICLHYHVRASFLVVLIINSIVYWGYSKTWPVSIGRFPYAPYVDSLSLPYERSTAVVMLDLAFLSIVSLNGLGRGFGDLAKLTRANNTVPRIRLFYLFCGAFSVMSGFFGGPPLVISPETGAGKIVNPSSILLAILSLHLAFTL